MSLFAALAVSDNKMSLGAYSGEGYILPPGQVWYLNIGYEYEFEIGYGAFFYAGQSYGTNFWRGLWKFFMHGRFKFDFEMLDFYRHIFNLRMIIADYSPLTLEQTWPANFKGAFCTSDRKSVV